MKSRMIGMMAAVVMLGGCAAANGPAPQQTSASGLSAGNAKLSVKMSSSIFLQPVGPAKQVVYLDGHNTSSAQDLHFSQEVRQELISKGYRITRNPAKAHYMLMWNVRYVGKETKSHTAQGALAGGFGGAMLASALSSNDSAGAMVGGSLAGAIVGGVIGHMLASNRYMMVVDIQLEQRQRGATTNSTTVARQGLGNSTQTSGGAIHGWMVFRDRIVAQASGRQLAFSYAVPSLTKEVAGELAGVF